MANIAIIGGTGLTSLNGLEVLGREIHVSKYGEPSAPLIRGLYENKEIIFLPRHGLGHTIPPHKINYRANISVLKQIGVENIVAINAVGGITENMVPQCLVVPDQIIDYTWSREHTFFEEELEKVVHIDFTRPYCDKLRNLIIGAAKDIAIDIEENAVYAATQGPRLETAAEIDRLQADGCDIVGMTGMPEAALARELDLCYASIAIVANMAAGRSDDEITMKEINRNLSQGIQKIKNLLGRLVAMV